MPRKPRIEYPGAVYHIMNRGDRKEPIFLDDTDRKLFLRTLGETCEKTGWRIHSHVLMKNHFHFVGETPQPNLIAGMHWLLGTYTDRFNRRHDLTGHLFAGRYKAIPIDTRSPGYFRTACEYVHLNPDRANLVRPDQPLELYPWSSFPMYLKPRIRPPWLDVTRLLNEYGIEADTRAGRRRFREATEARRSSEPAEEDSWAETRRQWRLGAEDFTEFLAAFFGRPGGPNDAATPRNELDAVRAERLVREELLANGWTERELERFPKGHPVKIRIAARLRRETPMTAKWVVERLRMGSVGYLSLLLWRHRRGETE